MTMMDQAATAAPLLEARGVAKSYPAPDGRRVVVMDHVDLDLRRGEIVGLLGRSGSGKSTLLRLIAGLEPASDGQVRFGGRLVQRPVPDIAMVFQSFALFPWLTVQENVALGLEARGIDRAAREKRALAAIDLVGLDGYESALPRELSGGMRQRVGIARALAIEPQLLLMDEPFSALDVLTAETLRGDFIELWTAGRIATKSVLIVTHNIEEAVSFCDRVLVFAANPGRVEAEIAIPLPQPRDRESPAFRDLVERIYRILTGARDRTTAATVPGSLAVRLPRVSANHIAGLAEALAETGPQGRADLPELAQELHFAVDELFPILEALSLLGFAETAEGDATLTPEGVAFVESDLQTRKRLFAQQLERRVPLAAHVVRVLRDRPGNAARAERFIDELEDHFTPGEAEHIFNALIAWGRYAELFEYDMRARELRLTPPEEGR